jgi:hypothetical protein
MKTTKQSQAVDFDTLSVTVLILFWVITLVAIIYSQFFS